MAQNHVAKVSKKTLTEMTIVYQPNRSDRTAPYTVLVAKVGTTVTTAYQSGKVMSQGSQAGKEAVRRGRTSATPKKKISPQTTILPADSGNWSVIGSDEVGNGSYSDPVIVCAAYVNKSTISKLKALGVRDFKELTDPQIIQLSYVIKESIPYKLLIVESKKYNEIQPNYNVIRMKVALHNQATYPLLQELAPTKLEGILIDQFILEKNYRKCVRNERNQVTKKLFFVTKGEQYHVTAVTASVISRAAFLEELDKESAGLGFSVSSGAGSKPDQVTARILKKGGLDLLANYAKLHFANTQKAQELL